MTNDRVTCIHSVGRVFRSNAMKFAISKLRFRPENLAQLQKRSANLLERCCSAPFSRIYHGYIILPWTFLSILEHVPEHANMRFVRAWKLWGSLREDLNAIFQEGFSGFEAPPWKIFIGLRRLIVLDFTRFIVPWGLFDGKIYHKMSPHGVYVRERDDPGLCSKRAQAGIGNHPHRWQGIRTYVKLQHLHESDTAQLMYVAPTFLAKLHDSMCEPVLFLEPEVRDHTRIALNSTSTRAGSIYM